MGLFYLNQARYDESEARYREALAIFRAIDPKHFEVGKVKNGLALVASRRGRYAEAEAQLLEVETLFREVLGESHPFTWMTMGNRAFQIARQGRLAEAERLQRTVLERLRALNGPDSQEALDAESALAETLRRMGRPEEALPMHRRVLAKQREMLGKTGGATVALSEFQVAADLLAIGRPEDRAEARTLLDSATAVLSKQSPRHWRMAEVVAASARARELYQN
jgi:tetratricopeptide (TPR) repeat protein